MLLFWIGLYRFFGDVDEGLEMATAGEHGVDKSGSGVSR